MNHIKLLKLVHATERSKVESEEAFSYLMREANFLFGEETLSTIFSMSRTTIQRWLEGKTLPHVLMFPTIYRVLMDHIIRTMPDYPATNGG